MQLLPRYKKAPDDPGLSVIGFETPLAGAKALHEPIPHADLLLARRVLTSMVNIFLAFGKSQAAIRNRRMSRRSSLIGIAFP